MKLSVDEASIPAVQVLHLVELVQRWKVTPTALLRGSALEEDDLRDPGRKLPVSVLVPLIERARVLTGEPGLAIYFGLRMQVVSHGYVGFAAMTAGTLGEALELATRFAPTLTSVLSLRIERDADHVALVIDEDANLGSARDAVLLAILVGIWRIGCTLTGRELAGHAELSLPEPSYFARFRPVAPNVRFDQPRNALVFDSSILDYRLSTADPAALQLARAQCERAIELLGFDGRMVARVRSVIPNAAGGFRTLDEVAAKLNVSTRTLKRKLATGGTAYSTLLDHARLERARRLLESERLTLDEIAETLGYSDTANFTRAFRRWTKTTPAAWRNGARK